MRLALTIPFEGIALRDLEPLVKSAEAAGYDELWSAETSGADGFTPLALAAAWTDRVRLGTGVVNPYTRGVAVLAQHAAALQDASRGRFVLGLGASSDRIVQRWNGIPFEKPLTRMREALETLRPVLDGARGPGGFRLQTPPGERVPIYVAALRDKMLALGGELADGVFANFLPLGGTEHVVGVVREAAAGRDVDIMCRFFCIPAPEEQALGVARFMLAAYGTVPVYANFFRGLGWGEQIEPMVQAWEAGNRKGAVALVPDELVREIFLFGAPGEIREQLAAFEERGITTACLALVADPARVPALIGELGPAG